MKERTERQISARKENINRFRLMGVIGLLKSIKEGEYKFNENHLALDKAQMHVEDALKRINRIQRKRIQSYKN